MSKQNNFGKKKPQSFGNLAQIRESFSNFNANQQSNSVLARQTIAATADTTQFATQAKNLIKKYNTKINRNDPILEQIYSKIVEYNPADIKVKPLTQRVQKN